jgi:hypothetical protein
VILKQPFQVRISAYFIAMLYISVFGVLAFSISAISVTATTGMPPEGYNEVVGIENKLKIMKQVAADVQANFDKIAGYSCNIRERLVWIPVDRAEIGNLVTAREHRALGNKGAGQFRSFYDRLPDESADTLPLDTNAKVITSKRLASNGDVTFSYIPSTLHNRVPELDAEKLPAAERIDISRDHSYELLGGDVLAPLACFSPIGNRPIDYYSWLESVDKSNYEDLDKGILVWKGSGEQSSLVCIQFRGAPGGPVVTSCWHDLSKSCSFVRYYNNSGTGIKSIDWQHSMVDNIWLPESLDIEFHPGPYVSRNLLISAWKLSSDLAGELFEITALGAPAGTYVVDNTNQTVSVINDDLTTQSMGKFGEKPSFIPPERLAPVVTTAAESTGWRSWLLGINIAAVALLIVYFLWQKRSVA